MASHAVWLVAPLHAGGGGGGGRGLGPATKMAVGWRASVWKTISTIFLGSDGPKLAICISPLECSVLPLQVYVRLHVCWR